jgi:hypothetical protein
MLRNTAYIYGLGLGLSYPNPEIKRPRGRPGHRCNDDIKTDHKTNTVCGCGLNSSGLGEGPVAGSCEHSNESSIPK